MSRRDEFEARLDALIAEFSDIPLEDIADTFDFYASNCTDKAARQLN